MQYQGYDRFLWCKSGLWCKSDSTHRYKGAGTPTQQCKIAVILYCFILFCKIAVIFILHFNLDFFLVTAPLMMQLKQLVQ